MNTLVRPSSGAIGSGWGDPNTVSSTRTEVVPTATTRRPSLRAAVIRPAAWSEIAYCSVWIWWASSSSSATGRNVSSPTPRVTVTTSRRSRSAAQSSSLKCRPAVGAAAEPGWAAYTVW